MSLAIHLSFIVWVISRPIASPVNRTVSGEFVFVEPAVPEIQEKNEPQAPATLPLPQPRQRPTVAQKPKDPTPSPVDVPKRDQPIDSPRAERSLVPGSAFLLTLDAGTVQGPEVVASEGLHGLEAPKDLVGTLAKETLGRGRVDRGLVHPYYSQLGKALLKNWDADRVAKSGLKGFAEQTSENLKLYNEIWADRAAEFGSTGNPLGGAPQSTNRRAVISDRISGLPGIDLEQRKELQRQLREAYKATRKALIRVVQNSDGKLIKVELAQPSNDAKVDKEALADVRAAAEKLPPPPLEALEGKSSLTSLWSFELVISISPPVPTFTFEFDEALGFVDMRLPLDRRIYKKVRLVAVE